MNWKDKCKGWEHSDTAIKGFFGQYRWLSNFHQVPVIYEGIEFPSSENAYQYAKCVLKEECKLFTTQLPQIAKLLGKTVKLRPDWEEVKYSIMKEIILSKFSIPELRDMLIYTGDKYLEETNYWNDTYWGVCNGVGENNLGKILMEVRENLRK